MEFTEYKTQPGTQDYPVDEVVGTRRRKVANIYLVFMTSTLIKQKGVTTAPRDRFLSWVIKTNRKTVPPVVFFFFLFTHYNM